MMRLRPSWQLLSAPAGAIATVMALALFAPSVAEAGCSHLVTSRDDVGRLGSLVEPMMRHLAGASDSLPTPPEHRPCSGAWCSGKQAIPPVPPGTFEGRLESWAFCASSPDEDSIAARFLAAEFQVVLPLHRGNEVFHPPRPFPPL